jgi:UDP-3-O-[3-hydroxymyristoyl] glucosamine N-acyltransferase
MTRIGSGTIRRELGIDVPDGLEFARLGLIDADEPEVLTFLDEDRFLVPLVDNPNVAGVLTSAEREEQIRIHRDDIEVLVVEDPRWAYYTLHNAIARASYCKAPSEIDSSAVVHPTAYVSGVNVVIGARSIIGPNATILADVTIGADCVIQAGTVVGSEGFEVKQTSKGVLPVFHDGQVVLEDGVQIGANCTIDKGFRARPTFIAAGTAIDNLVHVAHAVRIGPGTLVTAGTILAGSVTIGPNSWISVNASVAPGLTLGERAFVSIGSVVTRDVAPGEQVTGNFAVPHRTFLRVLRSNLKAAAAGDEPRSKPRES